VVASIAPNVEAEMEQRSKSYHGAQQEHEHHTHGDEAHRTTHNSMFEVINDCQVLIAGGMGEPAYRHAQEAGLTVVMTGEKDIQTALKEYREGNLESDPRRIHVHK
jgi:predicted Fe-Mo cluster-binding NifX family protein